MATKKIQAKNIREAMILIKEAFGPDAVILSNKEIPDGVELIATDEYHEDMDTNFEREKHDSIVASDNMVIDLKSPGELAIRDLTLEFESLKNLVQEQLSELIWEHKKRLYPIQALVIRKLINLGFSAEVASRIGTGIEPDLSKHDVWSTVKAKIVESLPANIKKSSMRSGIFAIFGTSGVGKTITVAKLAAQHAIKYGAHNVAIISTDTTKIGASESLKIYANILKIPVRIVENKQDMFDALNDFSKKQLILIDTPGISPLENNSLQKIIQMFPVEQVIEKLLVVPANMQTNILEKTIEFFQTLGLSGCIITKIDESISMGGALSIAISSQLAIYYLSMGAKVPDDIQIFAANKFVAQILNLAVENEIDELSIARTFTETKIKAF